MLLVPISFIHYGPKDSEEGIKEYILVNSIEEAVNYIKEKHCSYLLDEDDTGMFSTTEDWWDKHPEKRQQALDAGLTIDEFGYVEGNAKALTLWLEGNDWKDVEDAHYGVTHWSWAGSKPIRDDQAATLIMLQLATVPVPFAEIPKSLQEELWLQIRSWDWQRPKHPELLEGEMFMLNGTPEEFERWQKSLPRGLESMRMGEVAYGTNSTVPVPAELNYRPFFGVMKK
jgi:hypothetical protein